MGGGGDITNTCINEIIKELECGIAKLKVYSLNEVWMRYCQLISVHGKVPLDYKDYRRLLKSPLITHFENCISFINQLDNLQTQLIIPTRSCAVAVQQLKTIMVDNKENEIMTNKNFHMSFYNSDN